MQIYTLKDLIIFPSIILKVYNNPCFEDKYFSGRNAIREDMK